MFGLRFKQLENGLVPPMNAVKISNRGNAIPAPAQVFQTAYEFHYDKKSEAAPIIGR